MARKYFPTAFDNQAGPFTFDGTRWTGPTGQICDEISNYFQVPGDCRSFFLEVNTSPPATAPHVTVFLKPGPRGQGCLSYNCAQRGPKNFKVQEALRPLADSIFSRAGSPTTGMTVYVSMFAAETD